MSEEKILSLEESAQAEGIFKKLLTTEVKYVIGIILFILGVVAPFYYIKTEIALIKQNHSAHIETMQKEILENSGDIEELSKIQIELMKQISEQNAKILLLTR